MSARNTSTTRLSLRQRGRARRCRCRSGEPCRRSGGGQQRSSSGAGQSDLASDFASGMWTRPQRAHTQRCPAM
eukprot:7485585-Alexandrium_andersonii.AAC.1